MHVLLTLLNNLLFSQPPTAPWSRVLFTILDLFGLACGLAGGIVALHAVQQRRERSWLTWLAMLIGLLALLYILRVLLSPQ